MEQLSTLWARILVVLKAAPTWLTAAAVVLNIVSDEIAGVLPAPWADGFTSFVVSAGAWLGAAVAIIRRVTPVLPTERGLLPPQ